MSRDIILQNYSSFIRTKASICILLYVILFDIFFGQNKEEKLVGLYCEKVESFADPIQEILSKLAFKVSNSYISDVISLQYNYIRKTSFRNQYLTLLSWK